MNKDIVDLLLELKEDIGTIASDVRVLKDKLEAHSFNSKKTAEKVEQLEKDAWKLKGAIAFIAFASTLVGLYKLLV